MSETNATTEPGPIRCHRAIDGDLWTDDFLRDNHLAVLAEGADHPHDLVGYHRVSTLGPFHDENMDLVFLVLEVDGGMAVLSRSHVVHDANEFHVPLNPLCLPYRYGSDEFSSARKNLLDGREPVVEQLRKIDDIADASGVTGDVLQNLHAVVPVW